MTGAAPQPAEPLTIVAARAFIAAVPWRQVRDVPVGEGLADGGVARWGEHRHVHPDPHQYVIRGWPRVGADLDRFAALIRRDGYRATYRAPYRPDHVMRNHYLELDGWCYWWIHPDMLNRERAAERKHVPIPE